MKAINSSDYLFFSYGLDLKQPWFINDISNYNENKDDAILINISFDKKYFFKCTTCGAKCNIYGSIKKTWRHIDFFSKKCYLSVEIPKLKCINCSFFYANTNIGNINSEYSFMLEEKIFMNSQFVPVKTISSYLDIPEKKIWSSILNKIEAEDSLEFICGVNNVPMNEALRSLL